MKKSADVIVAKKLSAGYPGAPIWGNATFSIPAGEFVGVLGPNGSGKTTLFRLLLGLLAPTSGSLTVLGETTHRGNPRVGYVPQRHPIDRETGIEALELVRLGLVGNRFGFAFGPSGREEAMEAMRLVGAEDLAHRSLGQLSGGELQRVFLAEALVGKPDLLLLDEPLSNLDIQRESSLVQLVDHVVRERGVTALLIAHNINPLLPVLDRVVYIAKGKVATGKPEDVLTSPKLSELYDTQVEVLRDSHGRLAIIGAEEPAHHHEHE